MRIVHNNESLQECCGLSNFLRGSELSLHLWGPPGQRRWYLGLAKWATTCNDYPTCFSRTAIANCVFKDDGSNCSIFSFDINANKSRLPLARNALKKLRTLRHPGVIKVLDTAEVGYSRHAMHRGPYENICRQKRLYILLQRGSHH